MAPTDDENRVLAELDADVHRTDRTSQPGFRRALLAFESSGVALGLTSLAGISLILGADAIDRPVLAVVGWWVLFAAALLDIGRLQRRGESSPPVDPRLRKRI